MSTEQKMIIVDRKWDEGLYDALKPYSFEWCESADLIVDLSFDTEEEHYNVLCADYAEYAYMMINWL